MLDTRFNAKKGAFAPFYFLSYYATFMLRNFFDFPPRLIGGMSFQIMWNIRIL